MIKSRRMRWAGHLGKSKGNRPLGRPRLRWEDIKMVLQDVGWEYGLIWLRIGTGGGLLNV
jgi:hypothetical protein